MRSKTSASPDKPFLAPTAKKWYLRVGLLALLVGTVAAIIVIPRLVHRAKVAAYEKQPIRYDLRLEGEVAREILNVHASITIKPLREYFSTNPVAHKTASQPDKGVLMIRVPESSRAELPQIHKALCAIHQRAAARGYQGRFVLTLGDRPIRTIP